MDSLPTFPTPALPADPAAADARVAPVSPNQTPMWRSELLLGGGREARIEHAGAVYRLRLTALGKLILTK